MSSAATWSTLVTKEHKHQLSAPILTSYIVQTWTPNLRFGGASVGITYSTQTGFFVIVGQTVFATFCVALSSKGTSTGGADITQLPQQFSANPTLDGFIATTAITPPANTIGVFPQGAASSARITLQATTLAAGLLGNTQLQDTHFANNSTLNGNFTYFKRF